MTADELRALDAEVAILIFGWKRGNPDRGDHAWLKPTADKRYSGGFEQTPVLPKFSDDIAAAWRVAEKSVGMVKLARVWKDDPPTAFEFECSLRFEQGVGFARAASAPLAICKAALAAVAGSPSPG